MGSAGPEGLGENPAGLQHHGQSPRDGAGDGAGAEPRIAPHPQAPVLPKPLGLPHSSPPQGPWMAQKGDGRGSPGLPPHRGEEGGEEASQEARVAVPGQVPLSPLSLRCGKERLLRGGAEMFVRAALFPVTKFLLFYKLPQ